MPSSSTAISADLARSLLSAAILAPSSHNTQPWLFAVEGDTIELYADRTRALPVNDPHDRELTISCGCALFNLRVAAAAAGWQAQVSSAADDAAPDLLARVRLARAGAPVALAELYPRIEARRTCRRRFAAQSVEAAAASALQLAAADEGARLRAFASHAQRLDVAALVAEGDALQWANPSWRRELAAWMHPRRRGDGLTIPTLALPAAQLIVRSFDMGHGVAARDRELADASPLITAIGTAADTVHDWLSAGQALQHALLVGLMHGLQASYLNQPVQIEALRPRLNALCEDIGTAQLLLRWGRPEVSLSAAPRRPLADVLLPA